jgi:solute carrier family 30 (zinc transporter), member 5/7
LRGLRRSIGLAAEHRMTSSYALPASAMTNGHNHGHGHLHSHSHSPGRQYSANSPRALKPERSNGSLHAHSLSESHADHEHTHSHHHHTHSHVREHSPSPYLPTPPNSNGIPPVAAFEKQQTHQAHEISPALSDMLPYEPPSYHNHHGHPHDHTLPVEPRSRITNFLLPFVLRWPLLHTIIAEKDSRRIFYFMR